VITNERIEEIKRILETGQPVTVSELARRFSTSEVTIRHDLDNLAKAGFAIRTRGGALPVNTSLNEPDFELRLRKQSIEKRAIAVEAAKLVQDGDIVALDASTTAYYLAEVLREKSDLTVVTNSLRIATLFLRVPRITVIMPGGVMRRPAASLGGDMGEALLKQLRINKGFFGARAISLEFGLMDLAIDEVKMKRAIALSCDQIIAIVDHTKWRTSGLQSFATSDTISCIVTDPKAPEELVMAWRARGVNVRIAGTPEKATVAMSTV
jgi:DeoR/GlpR family transcriptional regulator of sugar metabolism